MDVTAVAIVIAQLVWPAKLDLPGLNCAFRALRIHIFFGAWILVVEAMFNLSDLNNPDVHPTTATNHWIAAVFAACTAARRLT